MAAAIALPVDVHLQDILNWRDDPRAYLYIVLSKVVNWRRYPFLSTVSPH
ncbi:MAG: hypothetical protein AB1861_10100 [Cyanobacteriota bacterium]